jgi:hypothetical protein
MTDDTNESPELDDVMAFPDRPPEGKRRWIVLYEGDYDNFARDPQGNVGVLVNYEQAGEMLRLAAESIASMSPRDATGDDVLRDMIDTLESEVNGDD